MLRNGSFEGEYVRHGGTVLVAEGWTPFWSLGNPPAEVGQGPCAMPEYKPLDATIDARRVVHGERAQCWFLNWKVMDAGVYQVVPALEEEWYQFSVSAQAWCDSGNNPSVSQGEMYLALGIDPYGRRSPFEMGVLWSPWHWVGPMHERMESPLVQARENQVTVLIRAWNKWKLRHNDIYVDHALLEVGLPWEPPTPAPGEGVDYEQIRGIVRAELAGREPVRWPRGDDGR